MNGVDLELAKGKYNEIYVYSSLEPRARARSHTC